jgi:uncharacterized protein (DUF1499 family)
MILRKITGLVEALELLVKNTNSGVKINCKSRMGQGDFLQGNGCR